MLTTSIKLLPTPDRPRERLRNAGREALTEIELVSLVIGGDMACAASVVAELGGVRGLRKALVHELEQVRGIGSARACQLAAAVELGFRAAVPPAHADEPLRTPGAVVNYLADVTRVDQEELHVVALNAHHRPLGRFMVARGAPNIVRVALRDVFRPLVRVGASAAILSHNHPSGETWPSSDDIKLTAMVRQAADLLGIAFIDHIVISGGGFHSIADVLKAPR